MLRIYTASKLRHAQKWRELRSEWPEFLFVSRWIDMPTFQDGKPEVCREGWIVDEHDVRKSDIVMVYAQDSEDLRGALVEAGMGIALDKCLLLVGESESFGTWQHHPLCVKVPDLAAARVVLLRESALRQ